MFTVLASGTQLPTAPIGSHSAISENHQFSGGFGVELRGSEWVLLITVLLVVIAPAVWSAKPARRRAALEVLRTLVRFR